MDARVEATKARCDLAGNLSRDRQIEIADRRAIRSFKTQLRRHGLAENYCLLYQPRAIDVTCELGGMSLLGMSEGDCVRGWPARIPC